MLGRAVTVLLRSRRGLVGQGLLWTTSFLLAETWRGRMMYYNRIRAYEYQSDLASPLGVSISILSRTQTIVLASLQICSTIRT